MYENATARGLPFDSLLNVGTSAQTGVTALLRLYDEAHEPDSSLIKLLYVEVLNRPQEFLTHARSLSYKGCLLAGIKSGATEAGSRAAASHTGAMATSDTAVQALFDKAGIIRVQSRMELIDVATALISMGNKLDGHRVAVISDAGGPGVMLSDELSRQGFHVPAFSERTKARLTEALPTGAGVGNPVDCLPTRNAESMSAMFHIIEEEERNNVDYVMLIDGESGLSDTWALLQAVMKAQDEGCMPILQCFLSPTSAQEPLAKLRETGRCYFDDEVDMARALGRVVNRPTVTEPVVDLPGYNRALLESLFSETTGPIEPDKATDILSAAGIKTPATTILTQQAAIDTVDIPFPWVMKVVGPLHKTDVGGVKLGIETIEQAQTTRNALMQIDGATGVLIQQMVPGTEVLIGANREEGYGHLVAFGLGGIYTEALKDVNFCLAPLSQEEAAKMLRSTRSLKLIKGVRGQKGMDTDMLEDWLIRVGLLVTDFTQIREMDLNPVKGTGSNLYAVDARIILD